MEAISRHREDVQAGNLRKYLAQRSKARQIKEPQLSADDYDALEDELNNAGPIFRDSEATQENISGIRQKWIKFCELKKWDDWGEALRECKKGRSKAFLHFICETYKVKTFSSVHQYLLQFKQLYNRVRGGHMDTNEAKDVFQYLDSELATKFKLSRVARFKPVLDVDGLLLLLSHHWARDTNSFPTEDQRLSVSTIQILMIFTGARAHEFVDGSRGKRKARNSKSSRDNANESDGFLVDEDDSIDTDDPRYDEPAPWNDPNNSDFCDDSANPNQFERRFSALCYEDVRLWICQNPTPGERNLRAMTITFSHQKGADRKPKPTTFLFHEESLPIVCPVSHMIAHAIKDDAIEVGGYTQAEPFFGDHFDPSLKAVRINWKRHLLKTPIFRQPVRSPDGLVTSPSKALRYSTFRYYIDRLGWAAGFEQKLTSYCYRRCAANKANESATTAVRDQIMRHNPESGVFSGAYINNNVNFILQDAVLDQPTDKGLLRAFIHMSLTCDPRAPQEVPYEVLKDLPPNEEIIALKQEHKKLRQDIKQEFGFIKDSEGTEIGEEYRKLGRHIAALTKTLHRDIKIQWRKEYFHNIHNAAMEMQQQNITAGKYIVPTIKHQLPEREQLQQVICDLNKDLDTDDLRKRQITAINLMVKLSRRQEVVSCKPRSKTISDMEQSMADPSTPPPSYDSPSWYDKFPLVCQKTQCIFCLGNARLPLKTRIYCFSRPSHMMDHVDNVHLRDANAKGQFSCRHPICSAESVVLRNLQVFKNHVYKVHGVSLRA